MDLAKGYRASDSVALLAEGVDRNIVYLVFRVQAADVALLAEGVDRNYITQVTNSDWTSVALLAEGVDRNTPPWMRCPTTRCRPPRGGRG